MVLFTAVHPQGSPWYQQTGISCDIANTDICLSRLIQRYHYVYFMLCGDFNRVAEENPLRFSSNYDAPMQSDFSECQDVLLRSSEDKVQNQFGDPPYYFLSDF